VQWMAFPVVVLSVTVFTSGLVCAQGSVDAEITPTGKLRYGLNSTNAAVSTRAPDGSIKSIAIDLGRFVADRLGVPFEPVDVASTATSRAIKH
jgi:ABC-type amino acid transport substrate-binding protein